MLLILLLSCQSANVPDDRLRLDEWRAATRSLSADPLASAQRLKRLSDAQPGDPVLLGWLAYAYAHSDQLPEAIALLSTRPGALDVPENQYNLACYLARSGHVEQALKQLNGLKKAHPKLYQRARTDADLRAHLLPEAHPKARLQPLVKSVFLGSDLQVAVALPTGHQGAPRLTVLGPVVLSAVSQTNRAEGALIQWRFRVLGAGSVRVTLDSDEQTVRSLAPSSSPAVKDQRWALKPLSPEQAGVPFTRFSR